MYTCRFQLIILLALALLVPLWHVCVAETPPTIEAELRRFGVPLNRDGLQMALKDSRPDVRGLAASELAEIKDTASVPLIVAALRKEEHLMPKFNMAAALILLNSKVGNDVLSRICRDESVEEGVRLSAASRLFDVDDLNCLDSVENILIMAKDDSIKQSALLFLASIKNPPAPLTPRLHTALIVSLQDPTPVIRECASRAIAGLADKAAVPNLRVAIVNESDQLTKEQMEDSLRMLQGK